MRTTGTTRAPAATLAIVGLAMLVLTAAQPAGAAFSVPPDVRTIFNDHCVMCHGGKTPAAGHDYSTDADLQKLVGMPSAEKSTIKMIDPGHPAKSYLVLKITGSKEIIGSRMPLQGGPLSSKQITAIENWISGMSTDPPAPAAGAPTKQPAGSTKQAAAGKDPKPTAVDPKAMADTMFDGSYTFNKKCSDCHGKSGEGVTLFGPPLAGDVTVKVDAPEEIAYVINMGRKYRDKEYPEYSGMPKFQFITGGELQALIDYIQGPLQDMQAGSGK